MSNAYIMTDEVINLVVDNKAFTVTQAHVNYGLIHSELVASFQ
jgi:hypothetical protein